MHALVLEECVDLVEFFLGQRSKENTRRRRGATSIDNDSTAVHPRSGVGPHITVDDDESVLHPATDASTGCAAHEQMTTCHFGASVIAASVHDGYVP